MRTTRQESTGPTGAIVGNWRGYARYQCSACEYDTLDAGKFASHYQVVHESLEAHADPAPEFAASAPAAGETLAEE